MTKFPTGGRLVSWGGKPPAGQPVRQAPGRARHKKGNKYLAAVTCETAIQPARPTPQRRPLPQARPQPRQSQSLGHSRQHPAEGLPKLLSSPGMRYKALGPDYCERTAPTRRKIAYHVREIEALGLEVTLCRIPDPNRTDPEQPRPPDPYRPASPTGHKTTAGPCRVPS